MKKILLLLTAFSIILTSCGAGAPATAIPIEDTTPSPPNPTEPPAATATEEPASILSYEGQSFDEFLENSYRDLKLIYPETYVELSLDYIYKINPLEMNDLSNEKLEESYEKFQAVLDALGKFDRAQLAPQQQLSYSIYEAWLTDELDSYDFRYHFYIESGFTITSASFLTEFFFTDNHPLEDEEDVKNYLTRLEGVDDKFAGLIEALEIRQEKGLIPPRYLVSGLLNRIRGVTGSLVVSTPYYSALQNGISGIESITSDERQVYLGQAKDTITNSILPAYEELKELLVELEGQAPLNDGVWQFENGEAFYNYLLAHHTTTDLSADEIHNLGLQELDRIHAEMQTLFDQLGYPQDQTLEQKYNKVYSDGGVLTGADISAVYIDLIEKADQNLAVAFELLPQQEVIVITDQPGGFYVPGSLDGTRPGAFYAGVAGEMPYYRMPSFTYHEALPGHHLQIALAQEMDLPTFRRVENFTAYVEGWGLYAERLAWELGWYEDNPYGDLGRLQYEALRAARLVVDTGIHAKGWTFNQATAFFVENTGFSNGYAQNQIYRYVSYPGQATAYMVGMLKILDLRQMAQDQLGDQFDLKEFHQVVIGNGSVPLNILEQIVIEYINSK